MVKIIDIDLDRRRISLSLKQANEGIDVESDEFDPSLYGMAASYDEDGNYIYPEGFDPETNEWKPGYDEQRIAWEQQYAEAQARWEAHRKQVIEAEQAARKPLLPMVAPSRPTPVARLRARWRPTRLCRLFVTS